MSNLTILFVPWLSLPNIMNIVLENDQFRKQLLKVDHMGILSWTIVGILAGWMTNQIYKIPSQQMRLERIVAGVAGARCRRCPHGGIVIQCVFPAWRRSLRFSMAKYNFCYAWCNNHYSDRKFGCKEKKDLST